MIEHVELSKTKIYAAKHSSDVIRLSSSSGGAFTALSDWAFDRGYAICCAIYNYERSQVEFEVVTNKFDRDKAKGSKYVQSFLGNVFFECEAWLKQNPDKMLMFFGVGCQVDGFRNYARQKDFADRVLFIDIICNGMPSIDVWHDYVKYIENVNKGKISYVSFKDKKNGWKNPRAYVVVNSKEILIDEYNNLFYNALILRPSCYNCKYTKIERKTDITIGDYWGIEEHHKEFYSDKGVSVLIAHSKIGDEVISELKSVDLLETKVEDCKQPRLSDPAVFNKDCENFWADYKKYGIEVALPKYGKENLHPVKFFIDSLVSKVKRKVKKCFLSISRKF